MAANNSFKFSGYSIQQPLASIFPNPVVSNRAPTVADINYPLGMCWVFRGTGIYFLYQVVAGVATWIQATGAAGVLTSLTVNPGPTAITGAFTLTAGINAVSIGADAADHNITMGSVTGVSTLLLRSGTGGATLATTNGVLALTSGTGAINIGADAASHTVTVGSTTGTASTVIQSGTGDVVVTSTDLITLDATGALSVNSSAGAINIGNNAIAQAINIGTAGARVITIGNVTALTGIFHLVGTGNYVLNGVGASTYDIGAATTIGTIIIGGIAQTGALTLGSSSGINTQIIAGGAGATTLQIANAQVAGSVSIGAGMTTGTISIGGTGLQTGTVSIAPGTGAQIVNIGTGGTGVKTINIGTGAVADVITIGSATAGNITTLASPITALPGPVYVYTGAGAPGNGLALHIGDLYIRTDAGGPTERMYIATGVGAWTNVTCAA